MFCLIFNPNSGKLSLSHKFHIVFYSFGDTIGKNVSLFAYIPSGVRVKFVWQQMRCIFVSLIRRYRTRKHFFKMWTFGTIIRWKHPICVTALSGVFAFSCTQKFHFKVLRSFVRLENFLYWSHKTQQGCRLARLLAKIRGIFIEKQILSYVASA